MQENGNLVIKDNSGTKVWASDTAGHGKPPYRAIMQNDCNFVIYDGDNKPTWATGTWGK